MLERMSICACAGHERGRGTGDKGGGKEGEAGTEAERKGATEEKDRRQ